MENPRLYTQETNVFRSGINKADLSEPITVYTDIAGNQTIADGNHRGFRGYLENVDLEREVIGRINKNVSQDPNFRPVSDLKIIEK